MVAGGAQGDKASAVAWQGAFNRTQARVRRQQGGWVQ